MYTARVTTHRDMKINRLHLITHRTIRLLVNRAAFFNT